MILNNSMQDKFYPTKYFKRRNDVDLWLPIDLMKTIVKIGRTIAREKKKNQGWIMLLEAIIP